jgi:tryptophan-rich sensory protein
MAFDDARNRNPKAPTRSVLALVGFLAACFSAALVGSAFTAPSIPEWYESLYKPFFTPPSWLFGPVWTALYLAIAFAGFLVWRARSVSKTTLPLTLFGVQLVLNALWSVLFFGLRSPGVALVEIVVLWAAILATLLLFRRISRLAGWLLTPYLAWVAFAGLLNFEIWRLNA